MEFDNKQVVVIALIAGLMLGFGVGAIGGFVIAVGQISEYVSNNLDELCDENMLAPQMRGQIPSVMLTPNDNGD